MSKKIVILRCLHSNDVCTGAACLRAFNNRTSAFARYAGEELRLEAYFSCDGCGRVAFNNLQGMAEKIAMIKQLAPDAVHLGVCTARRNAAGERIICDKIKKIADELAADSIEIVVGTH